MPGQGLRDAGEARLLSSCIIGADDGSDSAAHQAVATMELQLLSRSWPIGDGLGTLPSLQKALGLGRPACREAVAILDARGVLDIRRGPGGGLFVTAPGLDDVVTAMLMYLSITGATRACIGEFRLLIWRMVVEAAIERRITTFPVGGADGPGFALALSELIGNRAMAAAARLAEALVQAVDGQRTPVFDAPLEAALSSLDREGAFARLDALAEVDGVDPTARVCALDAAEQKFSRQGRTSSLVLAAQMMRELSERAGPLEAEWETGERFGCTDVVVRQARRILEDLGMMRCHRGRKGGLWSPRTSPAGVIRLLGPHLIASGMSDQDNAEAALYLATSAPRLAAERQRQAGGRACALAPPLRSGDVSDLLRTENFLLDLAGNPLLTMFVRSLGLANMSSRTFFPTTPEGCAGLLAYNDQILAAIASGDAKAAGGLARAKVRAGRGA